MTERYYVFNQTRQSFLHLGVTLAATSLRRLRGLLGRWSLRSDDGLWVRPSSGIHTIGLFFPIDVVYLDESLKVVHLIEHMMPFRVASLRMRCDSVLELPLRSIYASNTQLGDQLIICPSQKMEAYLKQREGAGVKQREEAGVQYIGHGRREG